MRAVLILLFISFSSFAQAPVTIHAELDTLTVNIGDQVNFNLRVERDESTTIEWPEIEEKIGELEIIGKGERQTTQTDVGFVESQAFKLMAFDSGYYAIPGLLFKYQQDDAGYRRQIRSKALLLRVETIPIDTTEVAIQPIKDLMDMPFHWKEAVPYVLGALGVLFALGLLLFVLKRRKQSVTAAKVPKVVRPAHEVALERLKKLEQQKVWQQGEIKTYYTELTEILREYVENRFQVPALELTTDEIVKGMKDLPVESALKEKFFALLRVADLVKFAKASPGPDEHNRALKSGEAFVQHTKNLLKDLQEEEVDNV